MFSALQDAAGLPPAMLAALRAATRLLQRSDEIEHALAAGGRHISDVLDEILGRIDPIREELDELREVATSLRSELKASRVALEPLRTQIDDLHETVTHLQGSLEHVLDRVPGLSADKAAARGQEIADRR